MTRIFEIQIPAILHDSHNKPNVEDHRNNPCTNTSPYSIACKILQAFLSRSKTGSYHESHKSASDCNHLTKSGLIIIHTLSPPKFQIANIYSHIRFNFQLIIKIKEALSQLNNASRQLNSIYSRIPFVIFGTSIRL